MKIFLNCESIYSAEKEIKALHAFFKKVIDKHRLGDEIIHYSTVNFQYGGDPNNIREAKLGDLRLNIIKNNGNPWHVAMYDKNDRKPQPTLAAEVYPDDFETVKLLNQIFRYGKTEEEMIEERRRQEKQHEEYAKQYAQEDGEEKRQRREKIIERLTTI